MKKSNRENLSKAARIGALIIAVIMILGYVLQSITGVF